MFKTPITTTPLTSDVANSYFSEKIFGDSYGGDISFLATLRALLDPRMGEKDVLYLSFNSTCYSSDQLRSIDHRTAMSVLERGVAVNNMLYIHNFDASSPESNEAWMKLVEDSFEKDYPGWHRIEKVTLFFRKEFRVLCFINPEMKSAAIYTAGMTVRTMHYLQCGIFSYFPWYFDPGEGVEETEMELVRSLRERTSSEKYMACLAKIAARYDFRTARIRSLLRGFETRYEQRQCESVKQQISSIISNLDDLNERVMTYLRQKRDCEIKLLGLETKIAQASEDSEIMEYFLCNSHLLLESVSNSTMRFIVYDYLTYYDEDMLKRILANKNSYIYCPDHRDCSSIISKSDMEMLMRAVFLDEKLRMRFCAAYEFELDGGVRPLAGYGYPSELSEYTPNTHIDRFRCIGNYQTAINSRLREHDYIGAIEQCIASCKSLNFGDSPVMTEFMRRIYGISDSHVNTRFIELPDGRVVNPKEAVAYLKKEKEADENG